MAEGDKDKMTFFAREGVFYYRKMPFGLKNAGATYQRLVDKVFHDKIGRNLEAYVDDMGTERSLPLFKVLKSCRDKNNIQWTQEAEATLQEMKKFMEILPTLTAPVQGEILIIYLIASIESISAALFAKREEEQVPIYFISKVLQGAELNYSGMEKVILELVHAARRLQRGDEIPKDFLIEVPLEDNKKETKEKADTKPTKTSYEWKLFTDEVMSFDGFSAGLMLIDPEGKEYT
ncbi:reverse transcriptase domain-containing protein, partial [Tanacetum coccineum]